MRFLLLFAAALLLLVAPAKTEPESTTSESPITTVPTVSNKGESILNFEVEQTAPFNELRRKLAQAQAEVKLLDEWKVKLDTQFKSSMTQLALLTDERDHLSVKLNNSRNELREEQDKLKAEQLQKDNCKPSQTEMAVLLDRETSKQMRKLERKLKQSYRNQYADLLNELRRRIDKAIKRL
ncbi:uncharacterized protein [Drosophila kikkawai]|uniref:Uncharacterized protein n=1 Tax=Drosophila kikkawai TaxID=30033 RepID=A0A6P4IDS6_DROKI|nr:uncharacterized protein LOC108074328 [Drosophila kikkawai]